MKAPIKACECDGPDCTWCDSVREFETVEIPVDRLLLVWGGLLANGMKEWLQGEQAPEVSPQRSMILMGAIHAWLLEGFCAATAATRGLPTEELRDVAAALNEAVQRLKS